MVGSSITEEEEGGGNEKKLIIAIKFTNKLTVYREIEDARKLMPKQIY